MENIVLITYDSLRADHCGHHGYTRQTTPNLDSMAESGVTFENAIAPAAGTNPSMAAMFTGEHMVYRDRVSNPDNSRDHLRKNGTLAEELLKMGYTTAAFCPNAYSSRYFGFDRGFDHFEDFLFTSDLYERIFDKHVNESGVFTTARNLRNFVRKEEAFRTWDTYIDQIVDWTESVSEPYFLWVFLLDTHYPYLTPRRHRQWSNVFDQYYYNWRCNQLLKEYEPDLPERTVQKIIDIYDDSIRFGDVFLEEIQGRLGGTDPAYVVHADHGEEFGEHGNYGHFYQSLYEEYVHVPLVVSNVDQSGTVSEPFPLVDLGDIVRTLAGESDKRLTELGRDFAMATTYDNHRDRNHFAVRTERWKYIREQVNGERYNQLYDISTDRDEESNCINEREELGELLGALVTKRQRQECEETAIKTSAGSIVDT